MQEQLRPWQKTTTCDRMKMKDLDGRYRHPRSVHGTLGRMMQIHGRDAPVCKNHGPCRGFMTSATPLPGQLRDCHKLASRVERMRSARPLGTCCSAAARLPLRSPSPPSSRLSEDDSRRSSHLVRTQLLTQALLLSSQIKKTKAESRG